MSAETSSEDRSVRLALALLSGSLIAFEIGLTRLFSFLLHYHYTFLIVSGAVCGLGLGALLAFRIQTPGERLYRHLSLAAFTCGASTWLVTAFLALFPRIGAWKLLAATALPFVAGGLFLSLVFRARHRHSQRLYFYDLVGAALGTLWVVPALKWLGGIGALLGAGLAAVLAGCLAARSAGRIWKRAGLALLLVFLLAFAVHVRHPLLQIDLGALAAAADKPLFRALGAQPHPGRLLENWWSAHARTDLVDRSGDTGLNIYMDGGAGSYMFRFDGDFRRLFFLRREAPFFPYYFGARERVLILGAGGGADVLYALMTGWRRIEGVEINPDIVRLVRARGDYNGYIYDLRNVAVQVGDGRNYLERSRQMYDLIALPLVYAEAADLVGYALLENYLFTREAFAAYRDHLRPGGRLAIVVHNHPLMLRVVATLAALWEAEGEKPMDLLDHLVVINGKRADQRAEEAFRPLILVQKEPYTRSQLREIVATAEFLQLQPYFVPGMNERQAIARLRSTGLEEFVETSSYDIAPVTDHRPFFYDTVPGLDDKLVQLLAGAGLVCLFALVLPALRRKVWRHGDGGVAPVFLALFAAGLGCAFMLVEIHLLQRFALFLGYPTLTLVATLFALLLASGVGSLLSSRWRAVRAPRGTGWAAVLTGIICSLFALLLDVILPAALWWDATWRVLLTLVLVLPLGALMGICFPASLRLLGRYAPGEIPWMWGVNGVSSVVGSVMAVIIGMQWGTSWVLHAGAGVYVLAGGALIASARGRGGEVDDTADEPLSWRRTGAFLMLVAVLWYGIFALVAADYWRAAPAENAGREPPAVVPQVWPPTLNSDSRF